MLSSPELPSPTRSGPKLWPNHKTSPRTCHSASGSALFHTAVIKVSQKQELKNCCFENCNPLCLSLRGWIPQALYDTHSPVICPRSFPVTCLKLPFMCFMLQQHWVVASYASDKFLKTRVIYNLHYLTQMFSCEWMSTRGNVLEQVYSNHYRVCFLSYSSAWQCLYYYFTKCCLLNLQKNTW